MTISYSDAYLLGLPSIPVPLEVTHVEGCSCGGLDWHRQDCAIWATPRGQVTIAIESAHQRLRDHTDGLNRRLAAAIAAVQPEGSSG